LTGGFSPKGITTPLYAGRSKVFEQQRFENTVQKSMLAFLVQGLLQTPLKAGIARRPDVQQSKSHSAFATTIIQSKKCA